MAQNKMAYRYKPENSVRFSPRITKTTSALVERVCKRHEMFEADVLRFCLEAIAPEAARRGVTWLVRQIPHFNQPAQATYSSMFTVRTSRKVKAAIDKLSRPDRSYEYSEADILRFCYLAILPVALRDGFAPIMAMREKNLR